jgi:acetyltransferase-like isoleucine patch superfamily enzyme
MIKKMLVFLLPWTLKRRALNKWFGYQIDKEARIGLAWVFPGKLVMKKGARVDHFTVAVHLDRIELGENATIGRSNWITGFTSGTDSKHFQHQQERQSILILNAESAITKNHHIDCTNVITIGRYVTVAGYNSQLLTHSIDIYEGRQDSKPITIGDYCFIGTNATILGGASLPSYSVLGAKSLLNKNFVEPYTLYAGNPAKPIKQLDINAKYFTRQQGFIY